MTEIPKLVCWPVFQMASQQFCSESTGSTESKLVAFRKTILFLSKYSVTLDMFVSEDGSIRNLSQLCRTYKSKNISYVAPVVTAVLSSLVMFRSSGKTDNKPAPKPSVAVSNSLGPLTKLGMIGIAAAAAFVMSNPDYFSQLAPTMNDVVKELMHKERDMIQNPTIDIPFSEEMAEQFGAMCRDISLVDFRTAIIVFTRGRTEEIPAIYFFRPDGTPRSSKREICKAIALYGSIANTCGKKNVNVLRKIARHFVGCRGNALKLLDGPSWRNMLDV
jgi:uncharacterized protein YehS (DUF1456 family)